MTALTQARATVFIMLSAQVFPATSNQRIWYSGSTLLLFYSLMEPGGAKNIFMKKLKCIFAVAVMVLSANFASAKLGIGAGYLYQNLNEKTDGSSISSYNLNFHGFFVGLDYNANIGKRFAVVPGLYYEFLTNNSFGYGLSMQENYLKIPVDFQVAFKLGEKCRFIAGIGPKLHIGLSSKIKGGSESIDFYEYMDEFNGVNNAYNRFDVLLGVGIGLEFIDHIRINFGYDRGLMNRTAKIEGNKMYSNYIRLGLSYVF